MKTLLILTGPQGSGIHLWSRIFAQHRQVLGWRALNSDSDISLGQEPWAHCWANPTELRNAPWGMSDWHVTSISVPHMINGNSTVPDFKAFVSGVQNLGHRVKLAVLGRDRSTLEHLGDSAALDQAVAEYSKFSMPTFLSYELLHLYGAQYLQRVEKDLEFPIAWNSAEIENIIKHDSRKKK
jgi:hypothetical protein